MEKDKRLRDLLGRVFDSAQTGLKDELSAEEYERRRHDFVFHMTDWASDLMEYTDLVHNPKKWKKKDATIFIIGFLYHVVPHLNAAGRLLLDEIKDTFAEQPKPRRGPRARSAV
jgi:hypothetical protein